MDLNYSTRNIFPVPIHIFDVNGFDEVKNDLIDYAYNLKEKDEGVTISNYGGWQSSGFRVVNEDDLLHSFLINCLCNFPSLKKSVDMLVYGWININKPGDFNIKHSHPANDLSGVLWIKTPKNCGNIQFHSPSCFETFLEIESYTDDFRNNNNYHHAYWFPPIEGRMIIFPSHLVHDVQENLSNEERISVSFNIKLRK